MTKGQRIKQRREELNYKLTELAEKIDVSKQTLYKYENDIVTNIPSDKIEQLAQALKISPAYLMGWDYIDGHEIISTTAMRPQDKVAEFIENYSKASPEIQKAVELLLKADQHDS